MTRAEIDRQQLKSSCGSGALHNRWIVRVSCCAPFAVVAAGCVTPGSGGPRPFNFNLRPGQALQVQSEVDIGYSMQFADSKVHSEVSFRVTARWEVLDVTPTQRLVIKAAPGRVAYRARRTEEGGGKSLVEEHAFDSGTGERLPGTGGATRNGIFAAIAIGQLTFELAPDGRVERVQFPPELVLAMERHSQNPEGVSELTEEPALTYVLLGWMPSLPENQEALATGWSMTKTVDGSGCVMVMKQHYSLRDRDLSSDAREVHISLRSELLKARPSSMTRVVTLERGDGEFAFDRVAGFWLEGSETRQARIVFSEGDSGDSYITRTQLRWKVQPE